MKTLLIVFLVLFTANEMLYSQGIAINTSGAAADSSALLDISGDKGLLIPRMSAAVRNAITSPAQSLIIYNTTSQCLEMFANGTWQTIFCANCPVPTNVTAQASPLSLCSGDTLFLSGNGNGVTSWSWTGPNGFTSSLQNPVLNGMTKAGSGVYTLTAGNNCGNAPVAITSAVTIDSIPDQPVAGTHNAGQTQITWNWLSVASASGYKYNTINDYYTATDNGNNTNFTQQGLTCNTTYDLYVWAYNNCGTSSPSMFSQATAACGFTCGNPITVTHTAGSIAPVTKTVTYGTVMTNLSGTNQCWITRNLGADIQATAYNDASEQAAGWYWTFNKSQGYMHDGIAHTPSTWVSGCNYTENSDWQPANDPCELLLGAGWRIPTQAEWTTVAVALPDINTAYNSVLKIHYGGDLHRTDGTLQNRGSGGKMWTNTQDPVNIGTHACYYDVGFTTGCGMCKTRGYTLRCIK
jgi:hypothetical protein